MKYVSMKKNLIIMFILSIPYAFSQSLPSKIYCTILGNNDVKQEYRELAHRALKDFGITEPEKVSIKKMNHVGSIIALIPVSSFTAFGIWLDEKYLDSCTKEQQIFQIYHEAAHYACKHHQGLLAVGTGMVLAIPTLLYLHNKLDNQCNHHDGVTTLGIGAAGGLALFIGMLPFLVKQQEKQADLEAAKKLRESNKAAIVEAYLEKLDQSNSNNHLWWHSESEQIQYLTNHC